MSPNPFAHIFDGQFIMACKSVRRMRVLIGFVGATNFAIKENKGRRLSIDIRNCLRRVLVVADLMS